MTHINEEKPSIGKWKLGRDEIVNIIMTTAVWWVLLTVGIRFKYFVIYLSFGWVVALLMTLISLIFKFGDIQKEDLKQISTIELIYGLVYYIYTWPIILVGLTEYLYSLHIKSVSSKIEQALRDRTELLDKLLSSMLSYWGIPRHDVPIDQAEYETYVLTLYEVRRALQVLFSNPTEEQDWLNKEDDCLDGLKPIYLITSGDVTSLTRLLDFINFPATLIQE